MERIKPEYIGSGFTTKKHKKRVVVEDSPLLYDFYKAIGLGFIFEEVDKPKKGKRMTFPKHEEPEVVEESTDEEE